VTAVVFAYHDVGCRGIRTLRKLGVEIQAVYTHEDDPTENLWFGSVRKTCAELGIEVRAGVDMKDPAEQSRLRALAPRAIFSFYYRDLLPEAVLACAKMAAVNLHGSLLPRYRGRAPINWQILHGEKEGGVTLHHMVKKADAGDIVDQEPFPIGPDDTPTEAFARLLPAAERLLERSAVAVVEGTAPRWAQLESKATTFGRRRPEDGRIDWRQSAEDVRNLVRAVTKPYPGAFTFAGSTRLIVWWSQHAASGASAAAAIAPGTVRRSAEGVFVACGDGRFLRLSRVEAGEKEGDALEFQNLLYEGRVLAAPAQGGSG
jgi:UDP-4-amino-4-deoxy-L-arabinose formyltransferase/UDP-glucuronic acid dehydrogenase (UDP-4-keto-hexauronic acid decarboxylating)